VNKLQMVILDGHTINPGDLSWDPLKKFGEVVVYDRTGPQDVVERAKNADIIFTSKVVFNKKVIDQLPKLKYISVMATGYNVIDLKYTREKNIVVTNVSNYSTPSVTQLVFALIFELARHVGAHDQSVRKGEWGKSLDFCYWITPQLDLYKKQMGILGFGNIGKAVAEVALAFGMQVLAYDVNANDPRHDNLKKRGIKLVSIDELFRQSDVLTLHCPLTDETREIINSQNLSKMKRSALLINTGRGPLVHEADLAKALSSGIIAGAGLDVLQAEPPDANNPLLSAPNCILTPHIAWASLDARSLLIEMLVDNLAAFLNNKPLSVVN